MAMSEIGAGIYPRGFSQDIDWPWPLFPAKELVTLNYGKALRDGDRTPGNVPVYGTNGRCGWHNRGLSNGPGLILGRKGQGPLGVEWCNSDFWVIDTAYFVTVKDNSVDLLFLYYLVKYIGLNHLKDGTSNPSLSRDTFGYLLLPVPPKALQTRIAFHLRQLDDKIALIRKLNGTLESMARALFKSWFVDFAPILAKAEGRDTGLSTPVAAIFPDSLEASTLGDIPTGWTVEPIGNLTEVIGGTTPSTKEPEYWTPDTHAWATPKDLSNLQTPVLLRTERRISDSGLNQIGSGLLPVGTVLLSSRAPIGYLAVAEIQVAINQGFIAMKAREGVSNLFLLYWAEVAQETIKSRANGSTFLEISKSNFRQIELVRPSEAVMKKFDAYVRPWYERIVANEHEMANLITMRDALLPKLISGEIRVGEMEGEG